jgi:hypothetical protein
MEQDNVIRPMNFQRPKGGDGSGNGTPPSGSRLSMRDYVDSRDDAIESRLGAKLDALPTKATLWGAVATLVASIFTALAITLAVLSFGSDRFDAGMETSPAIHAVQQNQAATDRRQDAQMSIMDDKLDLIIQQTSKAD